MKMTIAKIAAFALLFVVTGAHGQSLIVNALGSSRTGHQDVPIAVQDSEEATYDDLFKAYDSEKFNESIQLSRQLHEDGDPFGSFMLGVHYESGQGTSVNNELAVEYYRTAAENGHPEAMWALAMMIDQGQGAVRQREESLTWARKAFDEGIEEAEALLDEKSIGTVLFADRQKYFNEFASRVVKLSESEAYLYDEKGNYVFIQECNEENTFCGYKNKLLSIRSTYYTTALKDNGGYLEICVEESIDLNFGDESESDGTCFFESYYDPDVHEKALYEKESLKRPFADTIPSFKGRTVDIQNWKALWRRGEFTSNSDEYYLTAIYFGDEYAWSSWINGEKNYLYSANEVKYRSNWNKFGVKSSKFCLGESLNTVFDISDCYDVFRIPEYTVGFDALKDAKFTLIMSDDTFYGSSAPRYGDIYGLQSKFDSQLWDPFWDGAIDGFIYGVTQGLLME